LIGRQQGGIFHRPPLGRPQTVQHRAQHGGQSSLVIVPPQLHVVARSNLLQVPQPQALDDLGIGAARMRQQPSGDQFDSQREPAQPPHDPPAGRPLRRAGKRPVLLQQLQRVGFRQFAQREPITARWWQQPRRGQQMQLRPQRGQHIGLLPGQQGRVGHVVQQQQDVTLPIQPLPQASGDGGEVGRDRLAIVVTDLGTKHVAQGQQRLPQVRLAFARHKESAARIRVGKRMGVGVGQLALADAAQAVHAADHAGLGVGQPRP